MNHGLLRLRAALQHALLLALAALALTACPSPEVVLQDAAEAAREGDREAYAACFTARSRPILEAYWDATDAHNPPLGALGAGEVSVTSVQVVQSRDFDGERALVTLREGSDGEDGSERLRVVLHRTGGNWRIDLLDTERALMGISSY